jgi:hypothetical protein
MLQGLAVFFTGVIAVATAVYVIVTARLLKATKRSAEAAKASAEAAKTSADIGAALHRPYLGVSDLRRHNDHNADIWAIRCCVKNYGTLPASQVRVDIDIDRQGQGQYGAGKLCTAYEIFPQAELSGFLEIRVDAQTRGELFSGALPMVAHVKITYVAVGSARCTHNAEFAYDRTTQNFRPERSATETHDL